MVAFQSMAAGKKQYEHPYTGGKFKEGDLVIYRCSNPQALEISKSVAIMNDSVGRVAWVYDPGQPDIDHSFQYDVTFASGDFRKGTNSVVAKEEELELYVPVVEDKPPVKVPRKRTTAKKKEPAKTVRKPRTRRSNAKQQNQEAS